MLIRKGSDYMFEVPTVEFKPTDGFIQATEEIQVIFESDDLECMIRRWKLAERIHGNGKCVRALATVYLVRDYLENEFRTMTQRMHDCYIRELKILYEQESTINGQSIIGLAINDLQQIYKPIFKEEIA